MAKAKQNKHGLAREIPPDVKQEVRKRSGFGCVICGKGIFHYDHVEPEYVDAKEHHPDGITLLCGYHHDEKTRGFLPNHVISAAMQNPKSLKKGYSDGLFYTGNGHPKFILGGAEFGNTEIPVLIGGMPIIVIHKPEVEGGPFLISGVFFDSAGKASLFIDRNEWRASSGNWDVNTIGKRPRSGEKGGQLVISEESGEVHLSLTSYLPDKIVIDRMVSTIGLMRVEGDKDVLLIKDLRTGGVMQFTNCIMSDCRIGISL